MMEYFVYLAIMALSTYLIRVIPFALVKGKIENRFLRSFLHYIPYAVLTAMTFPAILLATDHMAAAAAGLIVAVALALKTKSLTAVAGAACAAVFIVSWLLQML